MGAAVCLNREFYFLGVWPWSCCLQYGELPAEGRGAAASARLGHWREKRRVKNMDCSSCDPWSQPVIYSIQFIKLFSL